MKALAGCNLLMLDILLLNPAKYMQALLVRKCFCAFLATNVITLLLMVGERV
jgi:hypothetical protein